MHLEHIPAVFGSQRIKEAFLEIPSQIQYMVSKAWGTSNNKWRIWARHLCLFWLSGPQWGIKARMVLSFPWLKWFWSSNLVFLYYISKQVLPLISAIAFYIDRLRMKIKCVFVYLFDAHVVICLGFYRWRKMLSCSITSSRLSFSVFIWSPIQSL